MIKRQIIAMGGGGFSMEPDNLLLDLYVLQQSRSPVPKICFISTASGDSKDYIDRFYRSFKKLICTPSHLNLFNGETSDIEPLIFNQDIIYVGGGNTKNMLTLWKDWGLDTFMRKAYENGTILCGLSAGSICWFEQGVTDSIPGSLSTLDCLGWIKGSNCPHYDGESQRRPAYHRLLKNKSILPGIATQDGVAAHFVDEELTHVVSSHPDKKAYLVEEVDHQIKELELSIKYLGGLGLIIREASIQDAENLHKAHMTSIQKICSKDHSLEEIVAWGHRPYRADLWHYSILNESVWVVEDHGSIEGYGHLRFVDKDGIKTGHIAGLYLTPKVSGKEIGKAVINLMFDKARSQNIQKIVLESTLSAHQFYQRLGFTDSGEQMTVVINGQRIRCFPMVKQL